MPNYDFGWALKNDMAELGEADYLARLEYEDAIDRMGGEANGNAPL